MQKKIALVTCKKNPDLSIGDQILIPAFLAQNIKAIPAIWDDKTINWEQFDAVIIRNTWDYFEKYNDFLKWINHISTLNIQILNSPKTLLGNAHKFYLREFEKNSVAIIPTLFSAEKRPVSIKEIEAKNWQKMVIKPAVSAGSFKTEIVIINETQKIENILSAGDWLIQPLMPEIQENGEISLIFIGGKVSHSVIKTPVNGDFRVQRQFGGQENEYLPSPELVKTAENILKQIPEPTLYARVDGILHKNQFLLMELELIEPDLFLHFGKKSPEKFVKTSIEMLNLIK